MMSGGASWYLTNIPVTTRSEAPELVRIGAYTKDFRHFLDLIREERCLPRTESKICIPRRDSFEDVFVLSYSQPMRLFKGA
jgi:hypothetical protein